MNYHKIYNMDCIDGMKQLDDDSIDLVVTDPPYFLTSKSGKGFMGKDWDSSKDRYEFHRNWAKGALRVLKPGAFAFIMSIPRQDCLSRMIIGIEDAGFKVDFTSVYHIFASGFPKAMNMGKAVESKVVLGSANKQNFQNLKGKKKKRGLGYGKMHLREGDRPSDYQDGSFVEKVDFTSESGNKFNGSYAGFNPKPAVEVILVAMKPLSEKSYTDQAMKNEKGVTWLRDVRIPFISENDMKSSETGYTHTGHQAYGESDIYGDAFKRPCQDDDDRVHPSPRGRFPANLLISDDILNTGKEWKSGGSVTGKEPSPPTTNVYGEYKHRLPWQSYNDSGSFSRYFDIDAWWQERLKKLPKEVQKTFPFLIVPKASKGEKDKGLEHLSIKDIPYSDYRENYDTTKSYVSEYPDGKPRPMNKMKNNHPTVKPLTLMSYLITLGSRKNDVILDPFVGSGTVSLAAKMLSRKSIGIEINPEYVKIAKARLKSVSSLDEWL